MIVALLRVILLLFAGRARDIIIENVILKTENKILKRKNKKRIKFRFFDCLFYAVLCQLSEKAKDFVTLINPETVYKWQRKLIKSLYAMDFFTVDTVLNQRFYVFFIIRHQTREIIRLGITLNPVKEFVRQQIIEFSNNLRDRIYLIHDRTGEFGLKFEDYGICGIKTSERAPNMNAIAERFIGSVRREILDHFIIFGRYQLYWLLKVYIEYYNTERPHQGIRQRIPKGYTIRTFGKIRSRPILCGLNYDYYREAA